MLPPVLRRVHARGWDIHAGPMNPNLVVVRRSWTPDVYDDLCFLLYQVADSRWVSHCWPCCSVPSARYLKDPLHLDGTAALAEDQHTLSHRLGIHAEGTPRAREGLVATRALPVLRDPNLDADWDPDLAVRSMAEGINVHSGSVLAGCIGLPDPAMDELLWCFKRTIPLHGIRVTLSLLNHLREPQ